MNYEQALAWLKAGKRVQRKGWNGKGMWLILVRAVDWTIDLPWYEIGISEVKKLPWIAMFTADGSLVPWMGSQTDALADDYEVL